jgi:Cys-tRNA synthase (O-phospho-L-seryl-tRNA:Cys-tRNA synthase)
VPVGYRNDRSLTQTKVTSKNLKLKVAYVLGDNLIEEMKDVREKGLPPHLDSDNSEVTVADHTLDLIEKGDKPIVSANAYLGAREIVKGLELGADIIIAGRVADASPVGTLQTTALSRGKLTSTRSLEQHGTGTRGLIPTTTRLLVRSSLAT